MSQNDPLSVITLFYTAYLKFIRKEVEAMREERKKYSTYLRADVIQAVKNFAHAKSVSANCVIEAALEKCIHEKYWPEKEE